MMSKGRLPIPNTNELMKVDKNQVLWELMTLKKMQETKKLNNKNNN